MCLLMYLLLQEVFAITKRQGKDLGGLWHSQDGGKHWEDKTATLYGKLLATDAKQGSDFSELEGTLT